MNQFPPNPVSLERPPRSRLRGLLVIFTVLLIASASAAWFWLQNGLTSAKAAFVRGDFLTAGRAAERYLLLHPDDLEARLLAGKSHFQNNSLDPTTAANRAIEHFARIPADSAQSVEARLLQARAAFLILGKPAQAERLLQEVVQLDPDQFDAHYLLWQLYNMTERYVECEPVFREVFRLCPVDERAYRLREWYMSQFAPLSACGELDLLMGFRSETVPPSEEVALRRLQEFREREPQEPHTAAALAQWHLRNQSRETALTTLDSITDRDAAVHSSFYLATLVETLIEVGQIERAEEMFSKWTAPREGYAYSRIAGIYWQEVRGDPREAVNYLKKAVETWPGPADWLLMNRLSRCQALNGEKELSLRTNAQAERIEGLTDLKVHQQIRQALANLDDPRGLEEVARFYSQFERTWEADAWNEVISRLKKSESSGTVIP